MVGLAYLTEIFVAYYSGNEYERFAFINRALGPYGWTYWVMVGCNIMVPQFFWWKKIRRSPGIVFALSILINVGMWFERFVIIMTSLTRYYLPASWAGCTPTIIDLTTLLGSFGLFFTLFLLFARFLPMIAIGEVKGVVRYGKARSEERPLEPRKEEALEQTLVD